MKSDLSADDKMKLFSLSTKNAVGYFCNINYINKYKFYIHKEIKSGLNLGDS